MKHEFEFPQFINSNVFTGNREGRNGGSLEEYCLTELLIDYKLDPELPCLYLADERFSSCRGG